MSLDARVKFGTVLFTSSGGRRGKRTSDDPNRAQLMVSHFCYPTLHAPVPATKT